MPEIWQTADRNGLVHFRYQIKISATDAVADVG